MCFPALRRKQLWHLLQNVGIAEQGSRGNLHAVDPLEGVTAEGGFEFAGSRRSFHQAGAPLSFHAALGLPTGHELPDKICVVGLDQLRGPASAKGVSFGSTLLNLLERRKQAPGADAQIYGRFGILGALGLVNALLQIGHFAASQR